ncbi:hypothetical protein [Sphingomonas koreensis]
MERQQTLADSYRGHPFRTALPVVRRNVRKREDESDLKLFLLSYAAFFVCFYTFFI